MEKSQDIVARKIDDQILLLPIRPGEQGMWVYELNPSGSFLWEQMENDRQDEHSLARLLASEFDIPGGEALLDVRSFLEELTEIGAIKGDRSERIER
jgi:hypothetical protein